MTDMDHSCLWSIFSEITTEMICYMVWCEQMVMVRSCKKMTYFYLSCFLMVETFYVQMMILSFYKNILNFVLIGLNYSLHWQFFILIGWNSKQIRSSHKYLVRLMVISPSINVPHFMVTPMAVMGNSCFWISKLFLIFYSESLYVL
jgi:hypothetical protein